MYRQRSSSSGGGTVIILFMFMMSILFSASIAFVMFSSKKESPSDPSPSDPSPSDPSPSDPSSLQEDPTCTYGEWSRWANCINGKRTRERLVAQPEGLTCEPSTEEEVCADCRGEWEDDEYGCQCGATTKKQIFRIVTAASGDGLLCSSEPGDERYVPCMSPLWCPSTNVVPEPSPPATPPPPPPPPQPVTFVSPTPPPPVNCQGEWEDDEYGCQCGSTEKRQVFNVRVPATNGGIECERDPITGTYYRSVPCTPPSNCPNVDVIQTYVGGPILISRETAVSTPTGSRFLALPVAVAD